MPLGLRAPIAPAFSVPFLFHALPQVKFDYAAQEPSELTLSVDEVRRLLALQPRPRPPPLPPSSRHFAPQIISVLEEDDSGWWKGVNSSAKEGWFPSNYIERI